MQSPSECFHSLYIVILYIQLIIYEYDTNSNYICRNKVVVHETSVETLNIALANFKSSFR